MNHNQKISLAIETSCRGGGAALGIGEKLAAFQRFDASSRNATTLIDCLDRLLKGEGLKPRDLNEVYVSAGPGSFTGLRIGITVAKMLGQMIPGLKCVAVPTALVVAENLRPLEWDNLAVLLDARQEYVYACRFTRKGEDIVQAGDPETATVPELLAKLPRPVLLAGEALRHCKASSFVPPSSHDVCDLGVNMPHPQAALEGGTEKQEGLSRRSAAKPDVMIADEGLFDPQPENLWRVGRRLAEKGEFTDYRLLLPIYARQPEAVRLWQQRQGQI